MATDRLVMKRVLPASRATVYRALTDPRMLAIWWGPRGFTTPSIDIDLRVGGSFRIAMQPPEGELFHLVGEFREIDPPVRLAYSFRWDPPDPNDRETLVELSLEAEGNGTAVLLAQGEFATEARRVLHERGWAESFDRLADVLNQGNCSPLSRA